MNGNTTFHYDAQGDRVPSISKPVPEAVCSSEFGCRNCLYQSCECRNGSRYEPTPPVQGHPTCRCYAYCD